MYSSSLRNQELLWIKILNTAYPFGCNDNISGYGNTTEEVNFERKRDHPYFIYPCERRRRSHGKNSRAKRNNQIATNTTTTAYTHLTDPELPIKDLISYLRSLPKLTCRKLLTIAMEERQNLPHEKLLAVYFAIASLYPSQRNNAQQRKTYRWTVEFPNKAIEYIKLETILKDRKLQKSIPYKPSKDISITFTYNKPCKLSICNYTKILRNLTYDKLQNIMNTPCECETNPYTYEPLQHVLTGDLSIIENQKLRSIFKNGSKYRPATKINWEINDRVIEEALERLGKWFSKDSKLPIIRFQAFMDRFRNLYNSRKEYIKRNNQDNNTENIDSKALDKLHEKFVITVVDKAPNNLVLMCKKLFVMTLCKELGIDITHHTSTGNDVYIPITRSRQDIIQEHVITSRKYNIELDEDKLTMAMIYPIPKLHKNPHKFRFIASSKTSSMKPLSQLLDTILGHIKYHFRNICKKIAHRTGINPWWSIDSTYDYIDICHRLQSRRLGNRYIFTGDFSDMFTSCEHNTMQYNLNTVIDICFKNSGSTFLKIDNGKTQYTNDGGSKTCLRKEQIQELVEYILHNNYVTFADMTFKQVKGVPMGLSSAPKMIDLTMAYCEYKFMTDRTKIDIARSIGNYTCRYVDDFCSFTDSPIQNILKDIYPAELTLNQTSQPTVTNFLDTTIQLVNNTLLISVYNKTDDFPFPVIKYNNPNSNVHSATGYNTLYGEILRFARICSNYDSFSKRCRMLYHDFMNLGYERHRILITIFKFMHRNKMLMFKHGIMDEKDTIKFVATLED